jgi:hypothetical protein
LEKFGLDRDLSSPDGVQSNTLSWRFVMRSNDSKIPSDRKSVRNSDRRAGRATTVVLAGAAVVLVVGLVFAVMKVVDPDGTQGAGSSLRDSAGQGSGTAGGGASDPAALASRNDSATSGSRSGSSGEDRTTIGERGDYWSIDSEGGAEGIFGPDGRLVRERSSGSSVDRDKANVDSGKGGVGGTGYGAGGKSVLGKYAPEPLPKPEEFPNEKKFGEDLKRGVEIPEQWKSDYGLDGEFHVVGVEMFPATTRNQLETIIGNFELMPNPPEYVTVRVWDPYPPGGPRVVTISVVDLRKALLPKN